ncbi:MAG: MFS transporter [Anaeromyxobacter sp.]
MPSAARQARDVPTSALPPLAGRSPRPAAPAPASPPPLALLALGLAGLCAFLNVYATQPLLPLLQAVFGVSKAAAALTVSAPSVAVALVAPFAGALADRLGRKRVMVGALFALSVPTLLAATAGSVPALVAWRFLQGLTVPGVYAVGIAYAASEWQGAGVGKAMAALVTGNVVGGFLGRTLSGLAAERWGWPAAFLALGLLTLAGAAACARLLPAPARAPARRLAPLAAFAGLARRLPERRLRSTLAVGFAVLLTQTATFTYVTFHLAGPHFQLGTAALSGIFAVYLAGAAVTPPAGALIDRLGPRAVLVASAGVGLAGSALLLAPALPAVLGGLTLVCTANFAAQAAATTFLPTAAPPELRSVASGLYLSCYYLGGAVGGVLPALAWRAGGWTACVALVALVQAAAAAVALRGWRAPRVTGVRVVELG